ncbi:sialate O-acetylesterase [Clostridium sp. BNL1100]|uniref:sialate O-acetylesterase n=1 Tax=Clostridium sp. BNL1100 TaxID=755731 RepID=UPI00024A76E1|nr:sialate O-acetylesterase [Clostridium sp. BNL1100]AEY66040.1 dockerin-like protein [Clostridium sp. BNL1100]
MKTVRIKCFSFFLAVIAFLAILQISPVKAADSTGKPFLHPIFGDHMVLQRDVENIIWGWTNPGEVVSVDVGGNVFKCTAKSDGKWNCTIKPFSAGGPYQLKVTGSSTATVNDVYFGEIWLCSGQSNMAMQLPYCLNGDTEVQNSTNTNIRFFTTPYAGTSAPSDTFGYGGSWYTSNPGTVGNLSAAAYFFARELNKELNVPIGIVCSAVGGSFIESWISTSSFDKFMKENNLSGYTPSSPNVYYNGMISPLLSLKVKGVLWYQGESNTQYDYLYEKQLNTLVQDWRIGLGANTPFIIVQLPNYLQVQTNPVENVPWATIREAQSTVSQMDNNIGLVTTIDIGEEDIHPKNKQDVGKRAAICALGKQYGKNLTYSGPIYTGMTKENNKIRLNFKNSSSGLMAGTKAGLDPVKEVAGGTLKGFAIAGSDGKFVWADAVIDGSSVIVSSLSISNPTVVRYSWANNPVGNLYNKEGLPASPFRTDGPVIISPTLKGDINNDSQIDAIDFSLVKMHVLGIKTLSGDALKAADVDSSGSVDAIDLALFKKYLLGQIVFN